MQIRLPGDYTSTTDKTLNKPSQSGNTAFQTAGAALGSTINGVDPAPAPAKAPATNVTPTDPGAAAAQGDPIAQAAVPLPQFAL